jgi:hypothetical protein
VVGGGTRRLDAVGEQIGAVVGTGLEDLAGRGEDDHQQRVGGQHLPHQQCVSGVVLDQQQCRGGVQAPAGIRGPLPGHRAEFTCPRQAIRHARPPWMTHADRGPL